jgi:phosphoglycerate kinase
MAAGSAVVLDNLRFDPREENSDPDFAKELASLGDYYVNAAFGAAHRAHASTEGITRFVGASFAGHLMHRELTALGQLLENPTKPFMAIIGGSKVSTKITVLENLIPKVDELVIAGAMVFTFLKAQGHSVGSSLVEEAFLDTARSLLSRAQSENTAVWLPSDVVVADSFSAEAKTQTVPSHAIPNGWMGLDLGPESQSNLKEQIEAAQTVLWNGPMGVFEMAPFEAGTRTVAKALQGVTARGGQTILGGGDTVAAIGQFGMAPDTFGHVSTGGGASLEFLEGKTLPGVAALQSPETV